MPDEITSLEDLKPEQPNPALPANPYGPVDSPMPPGTRAGAGQIGSQLTRTFFLFDRGIQNPDDIGVTIYRRMYDTDETVAAAIDFVSMAVLIRLGQYDHEDPQIAKWVNDALAGMNGSFVQACFEILSALWAGYSVTEVNLEPKGSRVMLESLTTYEPETILFRLDDNGRLMRDGVMQYRVWAGSPVKIPTKKTIIYSHNRLFGNPYGRSACRRIYKNWLLKDAVLKMWATALDRFGTPLLAAVVPDMMVQDPDYPDDPNKQISALDYVMRVLNNIQNQTVLGFHKGTDAKALTQGGSGVGEAFDKAIAYFNKMIMRGVLLPSLLLEEGRKGGSYALGSAHFDAFLIMTQNIFRQLVEALVDQLIRVLIQLNFGPQQNYGTFEDRLKSEEDIQKLANVFHVLLTDGFLTPEAEEDWQHVRRKTGLPDRARGEADRLSRIAVTETDYLRGGPDDGGAVGADDEGATA